MLLLSLSDYIKQLEERIKNPVFFYVKEQYFFERVIAYKDFLLLPLTLEMFTSEKYFKGVTIQDQDSWINHYGGIRVFTGDVKVEVRRWFSEVFDEGKPRYHKTISDLTKYHIELQESLNF